MSTRRSLVWTYLAQIVIFVVTFGASVIVARLVSPRDFGIFGMAGAITAILNIFMSFGLSKYIMREAQADTGMLRLVFTVNFVFTIGYVIAILLGSVFARYVAQSPEVADFLFVFALFPIVAMFEFVPNALCARDMRFGLTAGISILRATVLSATTIALAAMGFAYMSFAWATVMAALATSIAYNVYCFRPDVWKPRASGFRSVLHFGLQMVGIGGASQLSTRAGEVALGSLQGLTSLGLYTRASSLPFTLYNNVYSAGSAVIFSRLSRDLRERGSFHETYVQFMRLLLGVLWPMMLGMAILAGPVVYVLYGAKWLPAALPLAILMLSYAVAVCIGMANEVFVLRHETKRQMRIESVRAAAGLVFFVSGSALSLSAAAVGKLTETALAFILYRRPLSDLIGGPRGQLEAVYGESLLLSVAAISPSVALMFWHSWSPMTPLLQIAGAVLAGVIFWIALIVGRRHPIFTEAVSMISALLRGRPLA